MKIFLKNDSLKSCFFMGLSGSFLIAGYEFVRNPSNSLFKAAYGMANYTAALAFMPFAVFGVLFLYSKLLNKYSAEKTLVITQLFSASIIGACYLLLKFGIKEANVALIIFREAYIVLLIEQLWSFINNTISTSEARKVNGAVLALSSLGGLLADTFIYNMAEKLGTQNLLVFCFLCFFPAIFFAKAAYNASPKPKEAYKSKVLKNKKGASFKESLGLSLFKTEPVLFIILFVIIASQTYSTVVGLNFQSALLEYIPNIDTQTAYSAKLFLYLHLLSLGFQTILVPFVLNFMRLQHVHFLVPLLNLGAIIFMLYKPSLESAAFAFILFKSLDYSLFRAAKEILYIPLSFDAKFRSKELIDVLGYRVSKGLSASVLSVTQKIGGAFTSTGYGLIGAVSTIAWFVFVLPIAKKTSNKENTQ